MTDDSPRVDSEVARLRRRWHEQGEAVTDGLRADARRGPSRAVRLRRGLQCLAFFAACLAVFWWCRGALVLDLHHATIRGTVRDLEGVPIYSARITLEGTDMMCYSGSDGSFVLTGVPPGGHWLLVELPPSGGAAFPVQVGERTVYTLRNVNLFRPARE